MKRTSKTLILAHLFVLLAVLAGSCRKEADYMPFPGENSKVDPMKLNALIFDQFQNGYYVTGEQVGRAWNAGAALAKAR